MILLKSGCRNERAFSAIVQLARQLTATGLEVVIDEVSAPQTLGRELKYEAVRFLAEIDIDQISHILIAGAADCDDQLLKELYGYQIGAHTEVTAIGSFGDAQSLISVQSKLAYVLGREPEMLDLSADQFSPLVKGETAPLICRGRFDVEFTSRPNVLIYLPKDHLSDPHWLAHLEMLANNPAFECTVLTQGKGKDAIKKSTFGSISSFTYAELPPDTLGHTAEIAVFFGERIPGERMATLALELMGNGGALVDSTERSAFVAAGAPAIKGPVDIAGLGGFLQSVVVPNLTSIRDENAADGWLQRRTTSHLLKALKIKPPRVKKPTAANQVLLIPTNGVGLGHAQRCALIASEMEAESSPAFAAFPSCIPMLRSKGFDCMPLVAKSDSHADAYANDLLNYLRLGRAVSDFGHLVFDGAYVFDGIYRTIFENHLAATWIRRGLWQPRQVANTPLERERAFDQVIVPHEVFPELNADYSFGKHVHKVGPIVQNGRLTAAEKSKLRNKLAKGFGRKFKKLVVTMLGGGIAADRSAQLQILASHFQARPDCLHLVVVWPNSKVSAGLFGWDNTVVVRTNRALELCQASDFIISAAGYNSFNEIMYHQIPAILVPQMAGFMDDQQRRALAASERDLAVTVMADQLLSLTQEVNAFLDTEKTSEITKELKKITLPDTGNSHAARLIEGLNR